jgi:NAD(P)-dependent dehydrogenase (short-subunit alcohol dehydrogenase family)
VALIGRRLDRLEALAAEIKAEGGEAAAFAVDVADAEALIAMVGKVEDRFGLVDILVNNAGIPDAQRAHKMSLELIDQVMGVNLRGPFVLSCEVARRLIAAKKPGRMINIASIAAFQYRGGGAALYSVTKAGVIRMTEALAVEWAPFNINVNAIAPGAFASEMMDGMLSRMGDITKGFPRARIGDPAQMDSTLIYLVSPASDFVTGTFIKIDDAQGGR